MLEAYTTLGYLAGKTERIELLAWVTAAVYREPGMLAKAVTTLDVLSRGRAWLGHRRRLERGGVRRPGHPVPAAPPSGSSGWRRRCRSACRCGARTRARTPGKHYQLGRTLNSPQSVQRPHPPILIGGGGEQKTLRMVAQYAQACNLFDSPELAHKLDVLRGHCERPRPGLRRDPEDGDRAARPGTGGRAGRRDAGAAARLAALGISHVHTSLADSSDDAVLEQFGGRD